MECKHDKVMVMPGKIEKGDDDMLKIDLEGGELHCRKCHEELPLEDLQLYPEHKVTVGIPTEMVD